ncbi:hypothetical protein ACFWFI_09750 [Streptomyces sp. NPDC060209]|uniref:hypothetical protein n=1 Tax=Streptomyces sp. NPDC060209 TaxID=3347073 RepID=UPI0036481667
MVFPQTPLDVRTELQIGGTWTDITADVYTRDPITITRGSADEASSSEPSGCSLTLNNKLGKYSPRNPMSPHYGKIGRNTPVRVSVEGPESYLQLQGTTSSYARTPDAAALDITGDLDLRVEATADWYALATRPLIGKYTSPTNQRSYMLRLQSGVLALWWSTDGGPATTFFASQPLPALPRRAALRAALDVNNGSGGFTAVFYWATSLAGPWTQIGDPLSAAGVTSIYNSTAPLEIAPPSVNSSTSLPGRVHRAEVRNGINGTVVASPDVRALAEGATGWTDSAGRAWTVGPAATISDRAYRFTGEISSWPPRWDVSGLDVWVPVEAAGVTRRLGQGQKALASTLRRRVPSYSPLAYWPMEDEDGAVQAYSPIAGVNPLALTGGWQFGQDDSLAGSSALPDVDPGARMVGTVPAPAGTATEWSIHMVYSVDTAPVSDGIFLSWLASGTVRRWEIIQRASSASIRGYGADGSLLVDQGVAIGPDVFVGWQRLYFYASEAGGTVTWRLSWVNIGGEAGGITSSYSGTTGRVTQIDTTIGASVTGLKLGHLAVLPMALTDAYSLADHGFSGETALTRLRRLASEESRQITVATTGSPLAERMGPQRPGTLLALFEEAAATDGGILYEDRDALFLRYRDRASLYNQPVALALDYQAKGEVPPPLEPVEDDQTLRNDVTINRSGGSSGRAVLEDGPLSVQPPPAGVGPYDTSETLSLYSDAQPQPIAEWRVHQGTWDEARYPTITVWLHAAPHLIDDVLEMDIGDRLTIAHLPPWLPPGLIDQHARGYTEVLGQFDWTLAMNCTPAGPWTVGIVEDPVLGRADTDGSQLASAVTSSATSWSVAVTAGPLWITTATRPAEFPLSVTCGGEEVTVTAISGTASPQTFTVTRSVNGIVKAQTSGEALSLTHPMRAAL